MVNLKYKITSRIAELKAELERYVVQANNQVTIYQGCIAELEKLIAPPQPTEAHTKEPPIEG